jgi:hypothetical protein
VLSSLRPRRSGYPLHRLGGNPPGARARRSHPRDPSPDVSSGRMVRRFGFALQLARTSPSRSKRRGSPHPPESGGAEDGSERKQRLVPDSTG